MSRAEKYIAEHTRDYSNEILSHNSNSFTNIPRSGKYHPWLTPEHARMAVEIAKEEVIEKDLALTWKDIREILFIERMVLVNFKTLGNMSNKDLCEEILRRFNMEK